MAEAKLPAPQRWRSENIDRLVKYYFDHNKMLDTLPKLDQIAADWADFLAQDPEAMNIFLELTLTPKRSSSTWQILHRISVIACTGSSLGCTKYSQRRRISCKCPIQN